MSLGKSPGWARKQESHWNGQAIWDGPNSSVLILLWAIIISMIMSLIPFHFLPHFFVFLPATDHSAPRYVLYPMLLLHTRHHSPHPHGTELHPAHMEQTLNPCCSSLLPVQLRFFLIWTMEHFPFPNPTYKDRRWPPSCFSEILLIDIYGSPGDNRRNHEQTLPLNVLLKRGKPVAHRSWWVKYLICFIQEIILDEKCPDSWLSGGCCWDLSQSLSPTNMEDLVSLKPKPRPL